MSRAQAAAECGWLVGAHSTSDSSSCWSRMEAMGTQGHPGHHPLLGDLQAAATVEVRPACPHLQGVPLHCAHVLETKSSSGGQPVSWELRGRLQA